MENDLQKVALQAFVGLAALLELLEEKGILTEDEYTQKYEEAKELIFTIAVKEMKKSFNGGIA